MCWRIFFGLGKDKSFLRKVPTGGRICERFLPEGLHVPIVTGRPKLIAANTFNVDVRRQHIC